MAEYNAELKVYNGTGWDEYYPKTKAENVDYSKTQTLKAKIQELEANQKKWGYTTVVINDFVSSNHIKGFVNLPGEIEAVTANVLLTSGTPYGQVSELVLEPRSYNTTYRLDIHAYGTFVKGHLLKIQVMYALK